MYNFSATEYYTPRTPSYFHSVSSVVSEDTIFIKTFWVNYSLGVP